MPWTNVEHSHCCHPGFWRLRVRCTTMEVPICTSATSLEVMLGYIWGQVGISCLTRRADLQPIPPGSNLHIALLLLRPDGILPWWIHQFHRTHAPDMSIACNPIRNVRARCRASGCKPITWSWVTPKCLRLTMRELRPSQFFSFVLPILQLMIQQHQQTRSGQAAFGM